MKRLTVLFFAALFLTTATGFAAPVLTYSGPFEFASGVPHKEGVTGDMNLYFDGSALTKVEMNLDKPVFNKTQLESAEQTAYSKTLASGALQISVIFKLKGTPHKWYYVLVADSADQGKTYAGTFYKVAATVADIEKVLTPGVTTSPTGWKETGSAEFTTP